MSISDVNLAVTDQTSVHLANSIYQIVTNYLKSSKQTNIANLYTFLLNEIEPPLLQALMEHTGFNQSKAATLLGLSRSTTRKKLQQYFGDRYFPQTTIEEENK